MTFQMSANIVTRYKCPALALYKCLRNVWCGVFEHGLSTMKLLTPAPHPLEPGVELSLVTFLVLETCRNPPAVCSMVCPLACQQYPTTSIPWGGGLKGEGCWGGVFL